MGVLVACLSAPGILYVKMIRAIILTIRMYANTIILVNIEMFHRVESF
jgi:hypothetical protein